MADKIDGLKFLKSLSDSSKKVAKEQYAKDLTKEKRKALLDNEKKEFKEKLKKEKETGSEAQKRLFDELKKVKSSITSSGKPIYELDFPIRKDKKSSEFGTEDFPQQAYQNYIISTMRGKPGTPTRIGMDKMDNIKEKISISERAIKSGLPYNQQSIAENLTKKKQELRDLFFRPEVDPQKAEYLASMALREYAKKTFPEYYKARQDAIAND